MKLKFYFLLFAISMATTLFAQQKDSWQKWQWLFGTWKGEGSGKPGEGIGSFTFKTDLDKKILVRKAHTTYPATKNNAATVHDDLLIVYADLSGNPTKAIYFDNEGHTINYNISYSDDSIVLLSDKINGAPIFRLTYTMLARQTASITFELSQDGEKFMTYVAGTSRKIK